MKKVHKIKNIKIIDDKLLINIDDKEKTFRLKEISSKLLKATNIEKNKFEVSLSRYGIHCSLIDEDISIDGLLGLVHSPKNKIKLHHQSLLKDAVC
ncbi:MAG: DUF2442 domain-containing protein [bacterium]|nr:DUF2442 domain-containing protein [bacterium]